MFNSYVILKDESKIDSKNRIPRNSLPQSLNIPYKKTRTYKKFIYQDDIEMICLY
jgi:hypothetical protein